MIPEVSFTHGNAGESISLSRDSARLEASDFDHSFTFTLYLRYLSELGMALCPIFPVVLPGDLGSLGRPASLGDLYPPWCLGSRFSLFILQLTM